MNQAFIVSPSPHISGEFSVKKIMFGVVLALMPALAASVYFFGVGAIITTAVAIISCAGFEYLIQKYILKTEPSVTDGSALLTGLLLAFNLPANLPILLVVIGSLVAIGIGKMSFGGLGQNPFNPALVGRVFLLISFPVQMTTWPKPMGFDTPYFIPADKLDAFTGATALGKLKEGLMAGTPVPEIMHQLPTNAQLFYGYMGGSMGEVCALALLLGFAYMLYKKIITWHIPVTIMATVFAFTGILHLVNPIQYASPLFH